MAADVVDVLEAVEVDDDQRERLARPACAAERLLDPVLEQHAVREAGQRVAQACECALPSRQLRTTPDAPATKAIAASGERAIRCFLEEGGDEPRDEDERGQGQCPGEGAAEMAL